MRQIPKKEEEEEEDEVHRKVFHDSTDDEEEIIQVVNKDHLKKTVFSLRAWVCITWSEIVECSITDPQT